jgi:hypothetical protein
MLLNAVRAFIVDELNSGQMVARWPISTGRIQELRPKSFDSFASLSLCAC